MARKGMMVGSGKRGYHNIIGKDPRVHSDSAKGYKQPQRIITPIPIKDRNKEALKIYDEAFSPEFFNESASMFNKRTEEKPKYEIVVDAGKPDTITANSKEELMQKIKEIGEQHQWDEPQFEVFVYEGDKDISDEVFEEYHKEKDQINEPDPKTNYTATNGVKILKNLTRFDAEEYASHGWKVTGFEKDQIKGGLGDKTPESAVNQKELAKGIKVEMEHTNNPEIAEEIAKDHLTEFPKGYYEELAKTEEKLKKENNPNVFIKSYHPEEVYNHLQRKRRLHFQSKENRDKAYKLMKAKGLNVKRRSSIGQQIHPEYVEDYEGEIETGFGNTMYQRSFPVLYNLELR
jgi:hypothetical protein